MIRDDDAGVMGGDDALIDGLLRELGRGGPPGADERFVGRVLRATVPRRRWRGPLAALAAGLLLAIGGWAWAVRPVCRLVDAESAIVRAAGWRWGAGPAAGDAVEVAAGGRASLVWTDGTRVDLGAATRVEIPGLGTAEALRLGHGSLAATVTPQPRGQPFILITPEARLTVEGTAFTVTSGANGTAVDLRHGALRVAAPTGEVRLLPGDAVTVRPGLVPQAETATTARVLFRDDQNDPGWTWRSVDARLERRWLEVVGVYRRVLAITADATPGTARLPVPVLPARWRAVIYLRATRLDPGAQVAVSAGTAQLPISLTPGIWQRVHLVGDATGVGLDGQPLPTRMSLARPAEDIGVAVRGAEVEIAELIVLAESP